MKNALILCCLLVFSGSAVTQKAYRSVIVGFYNLENLYDTIFHGSYDDVSFTPNGGKAYTAHVFNDKLAKLARVLSEVGWNINPDGPALLGIAEIENRFVLDTLLKHPLIAMRGYRYVHYDSRDFRGLDVALVYNPRYFKVERSRPIFVKLPEGTKDAVYTRDILWVRGSLNGERVHVFVNHWPSRSGGEKRSAPARMAAAQTLRSVIDSMDIISPGIKTIVMGDLNDDPVNSSITKGLKASGDKKHTGPDELYNPWLGMYKNGIGTLAYQDAWSLFDQILLSHAFLDQQQNGFFYYKHNVFKPSYLIETTGPYKGYPMRSYTGDIYRGGYSDHFPVYLVLLKR